MRGKFITIEGTEGVGKTTNIQFIQSWMDKHKLAYATTREPGGTPLAEQIRELLQLPKEIRQEDGTRDAFEAVFQALDADSSKTIDPEEFVRFFSERAAASKASSASAVNLANFAAYSSAAPLSAPPRAAISSATAPSSGLVCSASKISSAERYAACLSVAACPKRRGTFSTSKQTLLWRRRAYSIAARDAS